MKPIYLVFLIIFAILAAVNLYAIDYSLGFMHSDNSKFLFSFGAAVLGVIGVFVLNMWSKLRTEKTKL